MAENGNNDAPDSEYKRPSFNGWMCRTMGAGAVDDIV